MTPSDNWCPSAADSLVETVAGDELVIYHAGQDRVHVLNSLAAAIFDLCDGRTNVAQIVDELKKAIPEAPIDLEDETRRLVTTLLDKEILK